MSHYRQTRQALDRHRLAPKKQFGQNFLVNPHTAEAIVEAGQITAKDIVVEIGVGLGALTRPLAARCARVIGLEIDSGIIRFHQEEDDLPGNITLLHCDVLKTDFQDLAAQCGGQLKIIANLPYSISNPFIFKLIDNRNWVVEATIMLQKEVAERLMAAPRTKEYGVPSVLLQCCAQIKKLMTLKPAEFHPRPKIDSVVIGIAFQPPSAEIAALANDPLFSFEQFRKIVRIAFNQRRKTLLNTLSGMQFFADSDQQNPAATNKALTAEAIEAAGLSPSLRPETLTVSDFQRLAIAFTRRREENNRIS
ncbi:MAG: 16S rRNA (adenine(1518)-N(6)/adenine(1519)-N(6))-dimethyltransferase RsmA [Desulfopila sp.]